MNKFIFVGRLAAPVETRYSAGENATCISNFNLAVDKRFKRRDDSDASTADFFRITSLGKLGEFAEKYLQKGTKIIVEGRVENNNYTNKDGQKVYGFQFIAENIEFAESKKAQEANGGSAPTPSNNDFINQGIDENELKTDLPWE
jgi:single-strand DNA-binding protein